MKKILLLTLIIFPWITLNGQFSESQIKQIINSNIDIPDDVSSGIIDKSKDFEGIFIMKEVEISNIFCKIKSTVPINERIAIFKYKGELAVYSLNTNYFLGTISTEYNGGHYGGKFNPSGFPRYPKCDVNPLLWTYRVALNDAVEDSRHFNENVKSELLRQSQCKNCFEIINESSNLCDIWMHFRLEKIFPNEFEPPIKVSTGTGVIISSDGLVLTNRHVLKRPVYRWDDIWKRWILVEYNDYSNDNFDLATNISTEINGLKYDLQPITITENPCIKHYNNDYCQIDLDEDLILLKIQNSPTNLPHTILDTTRISLGQQVYTLGYPLSSALGNNLTYTNGYYSSQQGSNNWNSVDLYNLGINPGNSGGGIFNMNSGNLIGLSTARLNDNLLGTKTEGIAFATKLNHIAFVIKNPNSSFYYNYTTERPSILYERPGKYNTTFWSDYPSIIADFNNPKIFIRDNNYKPNINIETNQKATILITAF